MQRWNSDLKQNQQINLTQRSSQNRNERHKSQVMASAGENFISSLSDHDLIFETKTAIKTEREATAVVVRYFKEISDRELYLKHACSSLFQFATEKLGYCAASAQARINAMRLIAAVPEVESKIESGELTLTAAAKVQTFFQAERKENKVYSVEQKLEVINECLSKSTREVERELASRNPEVAKVEYVKPVGRDRFQVSFSISEETEEKMKHLKGLFAHSNPNMSTEELFEKLIELGLEKFDPVRKAERASNRKANVEDVRIDESLRAHEIREMPHETQAQTHVKQKRSRYIPASVKHKVWLRNANRGCEHQSQAGERCGERRALQIDHVFGFARGGSHTPENLRVLCAKHNRSAWRAAL